MNTSTEQLQEYWLEAWDDWEEDGCPTCGMAYEQTTMGDTSIPYGTCDAYIPRCECAWEAAAVPNTPSDIIPIEMEGV